MSQTKNPEKSIHKAQRLVRTVVRACRLAWGFAPWFAVVLLGLSTLTNLLPLVQAKITGSIIDSLVASLSAGGLTVPIMLVVLYALSWGLSRLSSAFTEYADRRWYVEAQQGVDLAIMKKRTEIDIAHYENADFQNLLTRAFDRGNFPIMNIASEQFNNVSLLIGILVSAGLAIRYPIIFLIVLVSLIPTLVVEMRYGNNQWFIWAENSPRQRMYGEIRSHITWRQGIIQTKLLQAEEYLIARAKNIIELFKRDQIGVNRSRLLFGVLASLISALGIGTAFYLIIQSVVSGKAGVGDIVFLTSVLGQFAGMSTSLFSSVARQYEQTLYVRDMFAVFDTKNTLVQSSHPIRLNLKSAPRIEFRDVSFKYEGTDKWVLKHVSFVIEPGEKIALVGENGAGKTTLLKLLARIYDPTEGVILVNDVSLREVSIIEWVSSLAILLQDYRVHNFTVAESIAMGRSNKPVSKKQAKVSAELSGADSFIEELTEKYNTQLGREFENGADLSQGQRQRLALARTIYRDGRVVILDEPTASVDAIAEEKFFSQIRNAVADKTLLLVSHRFNTVQGVDRIAVFLRGELVELGPHEELLQKKKGLYAKMWESQARSYIEISA